MYSGFSHFKMRVTGDVAFYKHLEFPWIKTKCYLDKTLQYDKSPTYNDLSINCNNPLTKHRFLICLLQEFPLPMGNITVGSAMLFDLIVIIITSFIITPLFCVFSDVTLSAITQSSGQSHNKEIMFYFILYIISSMEEYKCSFHVGGYNLLFQKPMIIMLTPRLIFISN